MQNAYFNYQCITRQAVKKSLAKTGTRTHLLKINPNLISVKNRGANWWRLPSKVLPSLTNRPWPPDKRVASLELRIKGALCLPNSGVEWELKWPKTNKHAECECPPTPTGGGKKKWARGEGNMWLNASETAYCRAVWPGAGAILIFFVWPGLAQTTVPVLPQTQWIVQWERERERGSVSVCVCVQWRLGAFITMVTNGTINHSTPPQLSSHPQSERQSLGPGLLEQHGH